MEIPRWIADYNPDESPKSRVLTMINAITNGKIGDRHVGDRELTAWICSELNSLYFKLESTENVIHFVASTEEEINKACLTNDYGLTEQLVKAHKYMDEVNGVDI